METEVARWDGAQAGAVLSLGRGVSRVTVNTCMGTDNTRETPEWKQMKTKKKKVSKQEDRIYNCLFLKGTGNKYRSNDEKLEAADGGAAPFPFKSFSKCPVLGPTN